MPIKKKRAKPASKKIIPKKQAALPVQTTPIPDTPPVTQSPASGSAPETPSATSTTHVIPPTSAPTEEPKTDSPSENLLNSAPIVSNIENTENNQADTPAPENNLLFKDENDSDNDIHWKKVFLFFGITVLFSGIIAVASFLAYQRGMEVGKQKIQQTLESQVKATPIPNTPTPTESEIDLSEFSIKILNGSDTNGEASKLKSTLEEEGYTISSVGNSAKSYTKTTIMAKEKVNQNWLKKLKESLNKTYILAETITTENQDDDVIVNIGSLITE